MTNELAIRIITGDVLGTSEQTHEAIKMAVKALSLPSAQPEIIHCNACKHWDQSTGKMKGYGLGRCDFHDVDLVTCNGFCFWAERRNDE